jgi:ribosomal protein L11
VIHVESLRTGLNVLNLAKNFSNMTRCHFRTLMIEENIQIYKREFSFSVGGAEKKWAMN